MSSLQHIKPVSKLCPGYLTSVVVAPGFASDRAKSDRDFARKVIAVHGRGSQVSDISIQKHPAKFEIHIQNVQLTEECLKYVHHQLGGQATIKVAWKFFDFEKTFTTPEECKDVKINFDSVFVYRIQLNEDSVDNLKNKKITFELFASNIQKQITLGKGRTNSTNVLDNVESKLKVRVEMFDYYKARSVGEKPKPSARLDVFFRLSCDAEALKALMRKMKVGPTDRVGTQSIFNTQSIFEIAAQESKAMSDRPSKTVMPTDSEINNFEEALDLVLTRNKALRTTQSEITSELKDRTQWLRVEADWRRTLQEHAILSGKSPHDIKWRQWRNDFTANVSIRTYPDFPVRYKPELTITILKMILFDDSAPMINEEMTQFYIEYSFLGYEGPDMETPHSLPKAGESDGFQFNFTKSYPIDLQKNKHHCHTLAQFIKNEEKLTFNVISEPEEDESVPIQACELVGFCEVNLFETAQLETNLAAYWFDINDIKNHDDIIGYLKIQIDGIQAMRHMALKVLAPPDYKIVQ